MGQEGEGTLNKGEREEGGEKHTHVFSIMDPPGKMDLVSGTFMIIISFCVVAITSCLAPRNNSESSHST